MTQPQFEFEPLSGPSWRKQAAILGKQTWHRVTGPGIDHDVTLRLGVGPDGRLGCTGVLIGAATDAEVTARALRTIPLGRIMTAAASYIAGGEDSSPLARAVMKHYAQTLLVDSAGPLAAPRRQRPGPAGWDDDHYRRVVEVYRDALVKAPGGPVPIAAKALQTSESSVRRWLKTARDRGIAGASIPGRAGERRPSTTRSTKGRSDG